MCRAYALGNPFDDADLAGGISALENNT